MTLFGSFSGGQMIKEGDALFTRTQQGVLGLLFGKPDQRFYANEIVRSVGMGRGTVRRELERLHSAGIILEQREGNQNYYQANANSPVYPELLGMVRKTFGIADVLRDALDPLMSKIEVAFIYGSVSKASDNRESDVDLMVIGRNLGFAELMTTLLPAEKNLQRKINPTIYTSQEVTKRLNEKNSFITRVMEQPKLWVKGNKLEFAASG